MSVKSSLSQEQINKKITGFETPISIKSMGDEN